MRILIYDEAIVLLMYIIWMIANVVWHAMCHIPQRKCNVRRGSRGCHSGDATRKRGWVANADDVSLVQREILLQVV